ncbi:hypothetical protein ACOMHN_001459 [Nucella lapillus]
METFSFLPTVCCYIIVVSYPHLGIGKVVYSSSKASKLCVEKLNRTSKMGNIMNVFVDTFGKERSKLIEEKVAERPKIEFAGPSKRDRSSRKSYQKEAYEPADDYEYNGSSAGPGRYNYPSSENSYGGPPSELGHPGDLGPMSDVGHSSDMSYNSGTPFSQSTYTPGSMYGGGEVHGQGFTPASDSSYSGHHHHHPPHHPHHHQPPTSHSHHHHQHHHHSQQQQQHYQQSSRYDMPPPPSQPPPPPQFNNSFVNFDPMVPPPPLPPEPIPPPSMSATPSSHYQATPQQQTPAAAATPDFYQQDRDHGHPRDSHDRYRNRHHDRDYDRGNERDRHRDWNHSGEADYEQDRPRNSLHGNGSDRSGESDWGRGGGGGVDYEEGLRHGVGQGSKVVEKDVRPPSPEPVAVEKTHSESLESRIQSLLRMGSTEEENTSHSNRSQDPAHTTTTPSTPHTPSTPSDPRHPPPHTNQNWPQPGAAAGNSVMLDNAPPLPGPTPTPPKGKEDGGGKEGSGSDMDVDDDDDDRMSLSSISSGEEKLQVNPPQGTTNLNSSGMGCFAHNSWQQQQQQQSQTIGYGAGFNCGGGFPSTTIVNGPFEPGFTPAVPDSVREQSVKVEEEVKKYEEESMQQSRKFATVLNSFIRELKAVMHKDLCKKMVEVSAFKTLEKWCDSESQKKQPLRPLNQPEKVSKPAAVKSSTDGMSSTIASLFESRHPWSKDGGLENSYGFGGFSGGGLLGIRGGMPQLPSFKKKLPTTATNAEGDKRKTEKTEGDTREAEEAESAKTDVKSGKCTTASELLR